jgi:hypothetical protein
VGVNPRNPVVGAGMDLTPLSRTTTTAVRNAVQPGWRNQPGFRNQAIAFKTPAKGLSDGSDPNASRCAPYARTRTCTGPRDSARGPFGCGERFCIPLSRLLDSINCSAKAKGGFGALKHLVACHLPSRSYCFSSVEVIVVISPAVSVRALSHAL